MVVSRNPSFSDDLAKSLRALNECLFAPPSSDGPPLNNLKDMLETCIQHLPGDDDDYFALLDRTLAELNQDHLFPEDAEQALENLSDELNEITPLLRLVEDKKSEWTLVERLCGDGYIDTIASFKSRLLVEDLLPDILSRIDTV